MRKRDFLKNKAQQSKDQSYWAAFRAARNEVNNAIDDNLAETFNCHFANIRHVLAKDTAISINVVGKLTRQNCRVVWVIF